MDINQIKTIIQKAVIDKYDNYSKAATMTGVPYPTVVRICDVTETVKLSTLLRFLDRMDLQIILTYKV
jgi:hypothetical protein